MDGNQVSQEVYGPVFTRRYRSKQFLIGVTVKNGRYPLYRQLPIE
jgi:hypothetical protein